MDFNRMIRFAGVAIFILVGFIDQPRSAELRDPYTRVKTCQFDHLNPTKQDFPGGRGTDELIVYTPEFGDRTGTNQWGVEATVVQGVVSRVEGNNSKIPRNGFVISGHGGSRIWISNHLRPGMKVLFDAKSKSLQVLIDTKTRIDEIERELQRLRKRRQEVEDQLSKDEQEWLDDLWSGIDTNLRIAKTASEVSRFEEAWKFTDFVSNLLDKYWMLTSTSPSQEVRGYWERISAQSPEEVVNLMNQIQANGANVFFPETLYDGASLCPSEIIPQHAQFSGWDPLAEIIREGHQRGIEVHAWVHNLFVGFEDSPLVKMHPEWLMQTRDGRTMSGLEEGYHYFSWSVPEARQLILDYYIELVRRYPDLDGIQLDYIRFPRCDPAVEDFDYSDASRQAYQKATGIDPIEITPQQPEKWNQWCRWREQQVSDFVGQVESELHAIRPELNLSAAVFAPLEEAREQKYQNWGEWVKNDRLDFICPMLYSLDYTLVGRQTSELMEYVDGNVIVLPGLAAYLRIPPRDLLQQVRSARQAGAPGIVIFSWSSTSPEQRLFLQKGPFRNPARPIPLRKAGGS